jgi:uncharacterized protein (TIGR01619 family)
MGFLRQFFKGKTSYSETAIQNMIAPVHQEDWATYLSTIDNDKVGAIIVDLGLKPIVPIKDRLNRLRIDITMKFPGPNGLPSPQEFETLYEIDEKLSNSLASKNSAVYAGHLNCQGKLSLYHYIGDGALFEPTISEAMKAFPDYYYEFRVDREEDWQSYTELLYPLPIQMQSIQNQKLVEQLKNQGDKLERVRPVNHFIYFRNESDLEHFLAEIKGKNFKVLRKEPVDDGEYKIILLLERSDPVDSQSIDDYVLYLWQKARDSHGDYDGWESSIVKE